MMQAAAQWRLAHRYDILVRAGIKTTSALVGPSAALVMCSRGVSIAPDTEFDKIDDVV
jgi:hypothetical protein